jgi:hypothetical protein
MCLEVFVASDKPLPEITDEPGIFVFRTQPLDSRNEAVIRLFSKPYLCAVTSVGGCACGFRYAPDDLDVLSYTEVPEEIKENARADYEASRESVRRLKEFLRNAAGPGTVEVYSCWNGDAEAEPETRQSVTLDHFEGDAFSFVEREFLTVNQALGE